MRIWQVLLVLAGGWAPDRADPAPRPAARRGAAHDRVLRTLIHTIVVSQARYNVPLMPTLIAAGVAGWFLALRRSEPSAGAPSLPRSRMELGPSASGAPAQRHPRPRRDRSARLRRALARREPVGRAGARLRGGDETLPVDHRHPERLAARPGRRRARPRRLTSDHPDRFLLGIGDRPPGGDERLQAPAEDDARVLRRPRPAATPVPKDERLAAALGPKMLDLAKERSLGTHPYFIDVAAHPLRPRAPRRRTRSSRPRSRSWSRRTPRPPASSPASTRSSTSA